MSAFRPHHSRSNFRQTQPLDLIHDRILSNQGFAYLQDGQLNNTLRTPYILLSIEGPIVRLLRLSTEGKEVAQEHFSFSYTPLFGKVGHRLARPHISACCHLCL